MTIALIIAASGDVVILLLALYLHIGIVARNERLEREVGILRDQLRNTRNAYLKLINIDPAQPYDHQDNG